MTSTTFRTYTQEAFEADARFLVGQCEIAEDGALIASPDAMDRFDEIEAVYGKGHLNLISHLVARTLNSIHRDATELFEIAEEEEEA